MYRALPCRAAFNRAASQRSPRCFAALTTSAAAPAAIGVAVDVPPLTEYPGGSSRAHAETARAGILGQSSCPLGAMKSGFSAPVPEGPWESAPQCRLS